ncbi:uncharacterized protein CHSO_1101 [Chryseobacterium sp. StRB126]|uniref:hypothetical protein n=1 Tax=Chryseobacterium sp. StRB126 TaxID=878220 RepID=UPI0004E988E7|nr:hypothetical protein [Chryseobacterium sp. StRB126]BAP30138.1 uncharacterized protein CHSO_1101 [Chryseobacterium sp. StRB126]
MKEAFKRFCESLKKQEDVNIIRDTKAIAAGIANFKTNNETAKRYAIERFEKHCKSCKFSIEEPIAELRVEDKHIPELSGKTCGECGCILSYKLRQSVKKCSRWEQ